MAEYGFVDGWERMGKSLKRIITGGLVGDDKTGYDMSKPEDREIKENLEEVQGKTWWDTFTDIFGNGESGLLFFGVILLIIMVFKD